MDQSISRSHAKLTVSSPAIAAGATPTAAPPTVTLKDLSKFGTRVNGCKVERNGSGLAVVELKNGEELKFGGTPTSTVFRHVCTPLHHTHCKGCFALLKAVHTGLSIRIGVFALNTH